VKIASGSFALGETDWARGESPCSVLQRNACAWGKKLVPRAKVTQSEASVMSSVFETL
jgi:hypothetical protein